MNAVNISLSCTSTKSQTYTLDHATVATFWVGDGGEAIESNQRSRKSSVRELHSTVITNGFPYSNPTAQDTGIAKRFAAAAGRFEGLPIPTPAAGPVAGGGQHA